MQVRVLLFASYADAVGTDSVMLEMAAPTTAATVLRAIQERVRGAVPPAPMLAVNAVYASPDTQLQDGDEVAIIPPVAGG